MLDLTKILQRSDYSNPHLLKLIGSVVINSNASEPVLNDDECLNQIGLYIINKFKNQPYTLPNQVIINIVLVKRWDNPEECDKDVSNVGMTIIKRTADFYKSTVMKKIDQALANQSIEDIIFKTIFRAIQSVQEAEEIIILLRDHPQEKPLQEILPALIHHLNALDRYLKNEEPLDKHLEKVQNNVSAVLEFFISLDRAIKQEHLNRLLEIVSEPNLICTLQIFKACNLCDLLTDEGIKTAYYFQENNTDVSEIKKFNEELIHDFIEIYFSKFNVENLAIANEIFSKHLFDLTIESNHGCDAYCLDSSCLELPKLIQFIKLANIRLNAINADMSKINSFYEAFNELLNTLESEQLQNAASDIVATIKPILLNIGTVRKDCDNYKNIPNELKFQLKSLLDALTLEKTIPKTLVYQQLQKKYLEFDKRFSEPPKQMLSIILQLTQFFEEIQSHINSIEKFINDNAITHMNAEAISKGNYIGHHKAYSLLEEVRTHLINIDKSMQSFEMSRFKCMSFDNAISDFYNEISQFDDVIGVEPIQRVFRQALKPYRIAWTKEIQHLCKTDIRQNLLNLKEKLEHQEANLITLIKTIEVGTQNYHLSPPAHNRYKRREPESAGTPKHAKNLNLLFSANQIKKTCSKRALFVKENLPSSDPVPTGTL